MKNEIADRAVDVELSEPVSIGRGFRPYDRFEIAIARDGEPPLKQQRDVIRAGRVAAVIPIDLVRGQIVLIRQFRLAAHLATGRGDMVEIVAGLVDADESVATAASRECVEEIGVKPSKLIELHTVLATPGVADELVTFFLGIIDASAVVSRGGVDEQEDIRPFVVSIDEAVAALDTGAVKNALVVSALQWLALHKSELAEMIS